MRTIACLALTSAILTSDLSPLVAHFPLQLVPRHLTAQENRDPIKRARGNFFLQNTDAAFFLC